ncbi:MAG: hypothetical protein WBB74_03990 [Gaiellaceae bacterium]
MQHKRALGLLGCAAVITAVVATSSSGRAFAPFPAALPAKSAPLLGLLYRGNGQSDWTNVLARLNSRSLRPLHGPRIAVGQAGAWSFSPDRSLLALTSHRQRGDELPHATMRIVDVGGMRVAGRMSLGRGYVWTLAWLRPDRLLALRERCCPAKADVLVLDPGALKPVGGHTFANDVVAYGRLPDGLVLLLAPSGAIGPARIAVVDADGNVRLAELDGILAGRESPPQDSDTTSLLHESLPGLAVDPVGRHAYVVSAGGTVADVALESLAVAYHSLSQPVSLLGRLRSFLEPQAEAKGEEGPARHAEWLGNGVLAVAGSDGHFYTDANGSGQFRSTASGLALIDTRTWAARTIAAGADSFTRAGDELLVTGVSSDSETRTYKGIGLAAYGPDGSQRFHAFGAKIVFVGRVWRGRAYVYLPGTNMPAVVDIGTGRLLGFMKRQLPELLLDDSY